MLKRKPGLHDQEDIELARLECGSEAIGIGRDFDLLHSGLEDRLVEKAPRLGPLLLIAHGVTDPELVGWHPATHRLLQGLNHRPPSDGDHPSRDGWNWAAAPRLIQRDLAHVAVRLARRQRPAGIAATAREGFTGVGIGEIKLGQVAPGRIDRLRRPGAAIAGGGNLHETAVLQQRAVGEDHVPRDRLALRIRGRPAMALKNKLSAWHALLRPVSLTFSLRQNGSERKLRYC